MLAEFLFLFNIKEPTWVEDGEETNKEGGTIHLNKGGVDSKEDGTIHRSKDGVDNREGGEIRPHSRDGVDNKPGVIREAGDEFDFTITFSLRVAKPPFNFLKLLCRKESLFDGL